MRIEEIELENIGIHKHFHWKPSPRLNLILGPNGSGKSTIFSALHLLLLQSNLREITFSSGKNIKQQQSRVYFINKDILTKTKKRSRGSFQSRIRCLFSIKNLLIDFSMILSPYISKEEINVSTIMEMIVKDKESGKEIIKLDKQKDIEKFIIENVNKNWYSYLPNLFVSQSFLSVLPIVLTRSYFHSIIESILPLESYQLVSDILAKLSSPRVFLTEILNEPLDLNLSGGEDGLRYYSSSINKLLTEKEELTKEIENVMQQLNEIDNEIKAINSKYPIKEFEYVSKKFKSFEKLEEFLKTYQITALKSILFSSLKNQLHYFPKTTALYKKLQKLADRISNYKNLIKLSMKKKELGVVDEERLKQLKIRFSSLQKDIKKEEQQLMVYEKSLSDLNNVLLSGRCPVCLKEYTNSTDKNDIYIRKKNLEGKISETKSSIEIMSKELKSIEEELTNLIELEKQLNEINEAYKLLKSTLPADFNCDREAFKYRISKSILENFERFYLEIARSKIKKLPHFEPNTELYTNSELVANFVSRSPEKLWDELKEVTLNKYPALKDSAIEKKREVSLLKQRIQKLDAEIEEIKRKILINKTITVLISEYFQPLRTVLNHHLLPAITKEFLDSLAITMKNYLKVIGSNYTVLPSQGEEFVFDCLYEGNNYLLSRISSASLSCGERVLFATTFLISLKKILQMGLNVLFIDEPTAHLDKINLDRLGNLFKLISDIESEQIFVITHDEELKSFVEQTGNLSILQLPL